MKSFLTKGKPAAKAHKVGAKAVLTAVGLNDNQDETFTVLGQDANGSTVDISSVATLASSSDNTAVLTVDPPVGMTSTIHGVIPSPPPADGTVIGTANLINVATWNDGSVGPLTQTVPCTVTAKAGTPTGLVVDFGPPVTRP